MSKAWIVAIVVWSGCARPAPPMPPAPPMAPTAAPPSEPVATAPTPAPPTQPVESHEPVSIGGFGGDAPSESKSASSTVSAEKRKGPKLVPHDDAIGITGKLDPEIIKRVIRARLHELATCVPKETKLGTGSFAIEVAPSGAVTTASASMFADPKVRACVEGVLRKLAFPGSSTKVVITYPIHVDPE